MRWWTMRQLQSRNPRIRQQTIEGIRNCKDPDVINQLCILLGDDNKEVSSAAQEALIRIGQPAVHLLLRTSLWTSKSEKLARENAKKTLIRMKETALSSVLNRFQTGDNDHIDDQIDTVEILSKIADMRALDSLIRGLQKTVAEINWWIGETTARNRDLYINKLRGNKLYFICSALEAIGDAKAIEPLMQSILDLPDESRRFLETMDKIQPDWSTTDVAQSFVPSFISTLGTERPFAVSTAIKVLGRIGDESALDPLIGVLYYASENSIHRVDINRALEQIDSNWMASEVAGERADMFLDYLIYQDKYPTSNNGWILALSARVLGIQGSLPCIEHLLARLSETKSTVLSLSSTNSESNDHARAEDFRAFHEAAISTLELLMKHQASGFSTKQLKHIVELSDEVSIDVPGVCSVIPDKRAPISRTQLRQLARQELHRRDIAL